MASELSGCYAGGSNSKALGGDLAYRYATLGASGSGSYGDLDAQAVADRMHGLDGGKWQGLSASSNTVDPWTAMQAGLGLIAGQQAGLPSPITPIASPGSDELVLAAINAGGHKPSWVSHG